MKQYSLYRQKMWQVSYSEWPETIWFITIHLECAIRRAQENQEELKLNSRHQLLAYAGGVNMVGENIMVIIFLKGRLKLLCAESVSLVRVVGQEICTQTLHTIVGNDPGCIVTERAGMPFRKFTPKYTSRNLLLRKTALIMAIENENNYISKRSNNEVTAYLCCSCTKS
jgi:hypothetical protein